MIAFSQVFAGVCGIGALLTAGTAVLGRYLFPSVALDWADEVTIMLLVWGMLLTCLKTTLERRHIAVDLLSHGRTGKFSDFLKGFGDVMLLVFALMMGASGVIVTIEAIKLGERTESTLRLPTAAYYASLPAGMALAAIGAALLIVRKWRP